MPDSQKLPLRTFNLTTAFNDAKAFVEIPEFCNEVEIIATGVDVYIALRDTNANSSDDRHLAVNLDSTPETKAALVVASVTVPMNIKVPGGKRQVLDRAATPTRRRSRGFIHYKPTGASGTGRLIINCYQ
jgi:hypothetical protein